MISPLLEVKLVKGEMTLLHVCTCMLTSMKISSVLLKKKNRKRCVSLFKYTLLLGSNKMLFLINEENSLFTCKFTWLN